MPAEGTASPPARRAARARTRAPVLAAAILGLSAVVAVAAVVFGVLNLGTPTPLGMSLGSKALEVVFPIVMLGFPAVGFLILGRHPRHTVGWLFLGVGVAGGLLLAGQGYALYGVVTSPGALPAARGVLWISSWSWALVAGSFPFLVLLFPTGRPLSSRWWWAGVIGVVGSILQAVSDALRIPQAGPLPVDSPIVLPAPVDALGAAYAFGTALWTAGVLAAAASLVLRYRRARGDERQQIRWFAYGGGFSAAVLSASQLVWVANAEAGGLASGVSAVSAVLIPIAVGIAILRYRLYEIDVVIERTVVYGAVSVLLLATYASGVVLLQALLRPLTAGSDLAVAGSTLSVVALFQPLRRRVQDLVDRRFYRSRYDAARTLDAFTARLRSDVDLDSVRSDIVRVIHETMRPAHASVWLREVGR